MADQRNKQSNKRPSFGSGLLEKAAKALESRQTQIDKQVEQATGVRSTRTGSSLGKKRKNK